MYKTHQYNGYRGKLYHNRSISRNRVNIGKQLKMGGEYQNNFIK